MGPDWKDTCQDRVLYLLYHYIEIVTVLVQHVIIVIIVISVLSTFLVASGPWEGRVPGKGGSLGRAGPWEGRVPEKGDQPGNSNAEVDYCHVAGADVLSADKPDFP